MEGIERIKRHILAQADAEVDQIAEQTREWIEAEEAEGATEVKAILAEAQARADEDARLLIQRGESTAEARERRDALAKKQAIADAIIERALEQLQAEPPKVRAERYAGWIRALGLTEGRITLAAVDHGEVADLLMERLPADAFSVEAAPGDFKGGVVVQHGRIRDNLTYDLIVRDHRPTLTHLAFTALEQVLAEESADD